MTADALISEARKLRKVRPLPPETAKRYDNVRDSFGIGYQIAFKAEQLADIAPQLNAAVEPELRGFAFEGVGTALAQRQVQTRQNVVEAFANGPGAAYETYIYVGMGLMIGKSGIPLEPHLAALNSSRAWLVIDGYGFEHGLSHWRECLEAQTIPPLLTGFACRVFDQGLGRSIWFIDGTDAERIPKTIAAFPDARKADLWGGVGYACSYAGGIEPSTVETLATAAGPYKAMMAQAAAIAARSRQLLNNPSVYTEQACQVLCGMSAQQAAQKIEDMVQIASNGDTSLVPEDWQHYRIEFVRRQQTTPVA